MNIFRKEEIIELINATIKRNFPFEDSYFIWLLALLSSEISCHIYLYSAIPLIIDYLYENSINNITSIIEVCICFNDNICLYYINIVYISIYKYYILYIILKFFFFL